MFGCRYFLMPIQISFFKFGTLFNNLDRLYTLFTYQYEILINKKLFSCIKTGDS